MKYLLLLVFVLCSGYLHAQYYGMDSVQFTNGFKGLALVPSDYATNPTKRYPLIVALGGNGEVGTQLNVLFNHGIPRRVKLGRPMYQVMGPNDTARFIYICPLPDVSTRGGQPIFMNGAIDYMVANYRVDTTKILVSGLSQGGNDVIRYGLWTPTGDPNLGSFGGFDYRQQRVRFYVSASPPLVGTPFSAYYSRYGTYNWGARFFHGALDGGLTPPAGSQIMNDTINFYHPGSSQRFLLAGYGHDDNVWDSMYSTNGIDSNINIYRWLVQSPSNVVIQPQPPLSVAGANQTITLPVNTVNLTGTGTGLNGATIIGYAWTKTSGPAAGTITSAGTANTSVTGLVQGVYVFTLTVTDNHNLSSSSNVSITVNVAPPPISSAGSNQTITLPASTVNLTGTGTGQNGATITGYAWTKTSGPASGAITTPTAATTTVTGLVQGVYIFTLTVTDNNGLSGSSTVSVTVNAAGNQPPIISAGSNQTITLPASTVNLTGTGTGQNGATISSYAWVKTSGPASGTITSPASASTTVTGLIGGIYVFTLTVTDNNGLNGSASVTITVNAASNQPPVANAGINQSKTLPYNTATLNGSGTGINGASIVAYSWSQSSGPTQASIGTASQASTGITNLAQGVYVFMLTVTDNNGLTGTASVTITVNAAAAQPPVAIAGSNQSITLPTSSITLSGSGTGANGASITSYAWLQTSGPGAGTITAAGNANTTVTGLVQGVYVFTLTVTDNNGLSNSASVTITVNAAAAQPPVANAGNNQSKILPYNTATLNGSGTALNGATIAAYSWTQTSGPSQASIGTPSQASTGVTNLIQGVYVFMLTVTDNNGLTGTASVTITINAAAAQPPVAIAGSNQSITLPTSSITLTGSGTGANGASITSYAWVKTSGPGSGTITAAGNASTTVTGLVQGVYVFTLTVTDNNGLSNSASVTVTVNAAAIQPPVANAGNSQVINLPLNTVTLNGTGTGSNGASIVSYAWNQSSGPSTASIVSGGTSSTAVNNLLQGIYVFTLTVTDNNGLSSGSSVTITVNQAPNLPPVANAGNSQVITLPLNTITLNGSGTGSNGASIVSYGWNQSSGPSTATIVNAGNATTVVNNLLQGVYVFTLTVTDNNGLTSSSSVTITVNPMPNVPPVANAGNSQVINLPLNTVTLTGSGSGSNGASIVSYAWSQSSGPAAATIVNAALAGTAVNNLVQGIYVFTLTVTDNNGLSSSSSVTVTVNAVQNLPPVASAGNSQVINLPTNSVTLSGTGTGSNGASIVSYAWSQSSGPSTATIVNTGTASTAVNNLVKGIYVFTLTVTDNNGLSSSSSVTITVNAAPNQPPVANAGADITITLPNNTANFNGTASMDPDGTIVSYSWNKISGPGATTIVNSNTATASAIGLVAGVYVFELTVTDNNGATSTDQVTVTVIDNNSSNQLPIANAGKDTTINIPANTAILSGINSKDPDGTLVHFSWIQVSGPAASQIADSNAVATTVSGLVEGTYVFALTVTDNAAAKSTATITITVANTLRTSSVFKLFPNPVAGTNLHMEYVDDKVGTINVTAYDVNGRQVITQVLTKQQTMLSKDINVSVLKPGMYYLEVLQADGRKMVRAFVKQ